MHEGHHYPKAKPLHSLYYKNAYNQSTMSLQESGKRVPHASCHPHHWCLMQVAIHITSASCKSPATSFVRSINQYSLARDIAGGLCHLPVTPLRLYVICQPAATLVPHAICQPVTLLVPHATFKLSTSYVAARLMLLASHIIIHTPRATI